MLSVGSSRVPRPNTLNVNLHDGGERDAAAQQSQSQSARTPKSATASAVARSAIRAGGGSSSTGTSPALPSALHHHSHAHGSVTARAASPASSSFNDELNRLLQADQMSLGMGPHTNASGSSSGFPSPPQGAGSASGSGNRRPPIGGRRLASVVLGHQSPPSVPSPSHATAAAAGFAHSNALPPLRTAAPAGSTSPLVAQSARGPRPRALGGLGSQNGAYTSRIAAKDAATAAAAAAAYAQQREVSSDSDSESDDGRGQPNAVSVNAAAALYASASASQQPQPQSHSQAHALPHSHPTLNKMHTMPAHASSSAAAAAAAGASSPSTPSDTTAGATDFPVSAERPSGGGGGSEKERFAAVDAFAIATPKQKTGTVLTLSAHLTRGPLTPSNLDKARAVWRWICENIAWSPSPANLGVGAEGTGRGAGGAGGSGSGAAAGAGDGARPGVPLLLERSESTPVGRARGVSEASAAAREAAKAAAESKMMEAEQARMGAGALGRLALIDSDEEADDGDGNGFGGGGSFRSGGGGGGSGQSRSGGGSHSVDVLSDVGEILRRRRASTEGLANLFQALLEGGGVECAKVEGYGKGCGLVRVAERFDAPQHFWNAFRLSPQDQRGGGGEGSPGSGSGSASGWALVDVAWSAGYINGSPPRLEKTFSPAYFRLNPTIFALQHFPTRCHPPPGRKALSKQMSDFVKAPEKMQMLEFSGPSAAGNGSGGGDGGSGPVVRRCISKSQFEDAMMIERGYLDLSVLALHPLGVHTVRTDTPLFTISLQAPNNLEFAVAFNAPQKSSASAAASSPPRFVDQCWHVSSTPLSDDPSQSRIDVLLVFPWKGTYTVTVRARRLASKLLHHDDVLHYRVLASCGFYDIRKERDVFVGFLARRLVVGADHEFESKFALTRPIKGHFELGQPVRLQIVAPQQVTRMVAVNNGRWIELQAAPMIVGTNGSGSGGSGGGGSAGQSQSLAARNRQVFEGDLKLLRFPDIQIHYKTKGQQFNLLYRYGVTEGGPEGSGPGSSALSLTGGAGATVDAPGSGDDRHGKIVLDSRGTCFEKRLHITNLKIGKRSAALLFDTKAGTAVKAEIRSGWNSAVKVNDKITVTQTGSRSAAENGQGGNGPLGGGSSGGPIGSSAQYDVCSWDVTTALSASGLYSVHIFVSSAGSGVYRFALVLYLRIGDRDAQGNGRGFNLDV